MRAPRPALSRLRARWRVGEDFFEREGAALAGRDAPPGLVDRLDDLGRPGLDAARLDAAVVPFFLDPGSLSLRVHSRWHAPFGLLWRALRPALGAVGQLHLPRDRAVIRARTIALDPARDGRPDVRGVLRTYASGGVMQVVAYATERWQGAGYMSAAFPLPLGALCGVLRLELLGGEGGPAGARLTSCRREGEREPVGVWFAPLRGPALRLPLGETLDLWAANSPAAPAALRAEIGDGETLVGRHVQTLCGLPFATHAYWFAPLARPPAL